MQLDVEHFACNVSDPAAMAALYLANLGIRIIRQVPAPPYVHFLADAGGRVVIEIYSNAADPVPDYSAMHPLRFHVAFKTDDPDAAMAELVGAGATLVNQQTLADGSRLVMLRDPWGLPLQLCKRQLPAAARIALPAET